MAAIGRRAVSLLFVVDDSSLSAEAQASLAGAIPGLINVLASGDFNQDGDTRDVEDFEPPGVIRAGVITTDMGTGGHAVPTCDPPDFGDDGVLRTFGNRARESCAATYPKFLEWQQGPDPAEIGHALGCMVEAGSNGCGIEQPLEAILKALSPLSVQAWTRSDYVPPGQPGAPEGLIRPFFGPSAPHGDGENAGFITGRTIRAIVIVSDDDDCSIADPGLFDADGEYAETPLGLRCFAHPEALHPIARYVNGFLQLQPDPRGLVFAPIVGIPADLATPVGGEPDWETLASPGCEAGDPRLCPRVDASEPTHLAPSCERDTGTFGVPPTRLLQVARALDEQGAAVTVHSVCDASYEDALLAVAARIRPRLSRTCLPGDLRVEADGRLSCELEAVMPPGVGCDIEGYTPVLDAHGAPVREGERAVCVIEQLVPDPSALEQTGWFYDTFTVERERACGPSPRLAFAGTRPPSGASLRFECSTSIEEIAPGYGSPCDPGVSDACHEHVTREGVTLSCDPILRRCNVACDRAFDCWEAGLSQFACDRAADGAGFCFDPTCSG